VESRYGRVERCLIAGGAGADQGALDRRDDETGEALGAFRCDAFVAQRSGDRRASDGAYLFAVLASLAAGAVALALRPLAEPASAPEQVPEPASASV
jgi:hypothetical protein